MLSRRHLVRFTVVCDFKAFSLTAMMLLYCFQISNLYYNSKLPTYVLWPKIRSTLESTSCALENNRFSAIVGESSVQ